MTVLHRRLDSRAVKARTPRSPDADPHIGVLAPRGSRSRNPALFKFGHGGARPGSGPKPRTPPVPIVTPHELHWYCVRAGHGEELTADIAVRLAGFPVFNPSIWLPAEPQRRDGPRIRPAKRDRVEPLFRRYFFTELDLAGSDWRVIRSLPGVDCLISHPGAPGMPDVPSRMPDNAIPRLRERCDENDCIYPAVFTPSDHMAEIPGGARIRIAGGPYAERFADTDAFCRWSSASRVALLLRTLDGERQLTVERKHVELA